MKISSCTLYVSSLAVQGLIQVPQNIINIFETNAQADEVRADSSTDLLFFIELTVCGCGRMNCQRSRVADVGKVTEKLQTFDELLACFCAAFDSKAEDCASAFV